MEPTSRSMTTSVDVAGINQLPETSPIWRRVPAIDERACRCSDASAHPPIQARISGDSFRLRLIERVVRITDLRAAKEGRAVVRVER